MTYKEFREWCEENGHTVNETVAYIEAIDALTKETAVVISKTKYEDIHIKTYVFSLVEKALELAKTPLEEREPHKKYYVVVSGSNNYDYVNKDKCDGHLFISDGEENEDYQTKFTKEKAEEIMKKLSFEMVEVEE